LFSTLFIYLFEFKVFFIHMCIHYLGNFSQIMSEKYLEKLVIFKNNVCQYVLCSMYITNSSGKGIPYRLKNNVNYFSFLSSRKVQNSKKLITFNVLPLRIQYTKTLLFLYISEFGLFTILRIILLTIGFMLSFIL
jgi:hypothetical protein